MIYMYMEVFPLMRRFLVVALSFLLLLSGPLFVVAMAGPEAGVEEPEREYLDGTPIWETLVKESSRSSRYLAATGEHCYVYVDGGNPSQGQIDDLVDEFDNVIWPIDTDVFGEISRDRIEIHLDNIDGPYGIGGYYIPGSWMFYIDVADLSLWGYEIAAHEFQHLIHDKHDNNEDLWLNEGMSDLAIHLVYGPDAMSISGHLDAFEDLPDNDLTVFENEMYDYGSAYLFALYIYEHFGGNDTIRAIVDHSANGLNGVNAVLSGLGPDTVFSNIELFSMWGVANILDDENAYDGLFGYESVELSMFIESAFDDYPMSWQADVMSWGTDYFAFRSGDTRDLVVDITRIDGSYNFSLIGIGAAGVLVRSGLVTSGNPQAQITMPFFGDDYELAYLAAHGWGGERYHFTAEFRDNTPPSTIVAVSPSQPDGDNGWYVTDPTIGFVTTEPCDTYFWWDDEEDEKLIYCSQCEPAVRPEAPQGNHALWFYSVDPDGNREETDKSHVFMVDSQDPETTIELVPASPDGEKGWYTTNVSIVLSSEEGATIYYRWDSGFDRVYEDVLYADEGDHTIYYYSKDQAGNMGEVHFKDIKVDTIEPEITYSLYPQQPDGNGGWYKTQPTVALSTSDGYADMFYQMDEASVLVYNSPFKVPQGTHTVSFWARDEAGNEGERTELKLSVDSVVPTTTMEVTPEDPNGENGWYVTTPKVKLEADDDADVYYKWNEGPYRRFTGTLYMEEGENKLYYYSKDKAGNVEDEHLAVIKVDTEEPETSHYISGMETDGWYLDMPTIELDVEDGATGYYWWDDGLETKYTIPILGKNGIHELHYYSRDDAGNKGSESWLELQVDVEDPVAYFMAIPSYAYTGEEISFDASNSSDNIEIVNYRFDFGDGDEEGLGDDPTTVHTYYLDGPVTVTLTVLDQAGREASYSKDIFIEKKVKDEDDAGLCVLDSTTFLLGAILLVAVLVAGTYMSRQRSRRRQLKRYVELYERQRKMARARKVKGKGRRKKVLTKKGTGRPRKRKVVKGRPKKRKKVVKRKKK
jgi:hypothetical protein